MNTRPPTSPIDMNAALGGRQTMEPAMKLALDANFGSVERWCEEIVAMATTMGGGRGWAVLTFQPREGTLVNRHTMDHTDTAVAGVPILTLGLHGVRSRIGVGTCATAADCVDAVMAEIDWAAAYLLYQQAVTAASDAFGATQDDVSAALLIDVRRAAVFEQVARTIPGARWRDPIAVASWAAELPTDREVVVYCVYGHEVGRATAMRLRAASGRARNSGR